MKRYRGRSKTVFKIAIQKVEKALQQAYRDRKARTPNPNEYMHFLTLRVAVEQM